MVARNGSKAAGAVPDRDKPPAPAGPGQSGTRPATVRPRRVLLVDDDDMVRKVLGRMLASRGFLVHTASSGSEARAVFDAPEPESFDLLVTDLMMPDGGGLVLARSLVALEPSLKVLVVSGFDPSGVEGWDPVRFHYLTKPFGSADLARAIEDLFAD